MRTFFVALLALSFSSAHAQLPVAVQQQLCAAAEEDSALFVVADALLESGQLPLDAGEQLLSLRCDGESLLGRIVLQRQAENLEFVVIDMGMDLDRNRIDLGQGQQSIRAALEQLGAQGDAQVRDFVIDYLKAFSDAEVNPNLQVSRYP